MILRILMAALVASTLTLPVSAAERGSRAATSPVYAIDPHAQFNIPFTAFETRFIGFVQEASLDPFIRDWVVNEIGNQIRHDLDFRVNENLHNHAFVQRIRGAVMRDLMVQITEISMDNLGHMAQAMPGPSGQYQNLLRQWEQVLTKLFFPKEAIEKSRLFISGGPDVNAYTYSPTPFRDVESVFFQALLQIMRPGEAVAVMGHEAMHVYLNHVLNGVLLRIVFNELGEILIPESEPTATAAEGENGAVGLTQLDKDRQAARQALARLAPRFGAEQALTAEARRAAFKQMVDHEVTEMLRAALGAHCHSCGPQQAAHARSVADHIARVFNATGERIHREIRSGSYARNEHALYGELRDLATKLAVLVDEEGGDMPQDGEEKPFKRFQRLMQELSVSQETSCDRGAMAAVGWEHTAGAMARLMGGPHANVQALIRQGSIRNHIAAERGDSIGAMENSSHPTTVYRVSQYLAYTESPQFRVVADPFLRATDLYFRLSTQLLAKEQGVIDQKNKISVARVLLDQRRAFTDLARQMSHLITETVVDEFRAANSADFRPVHLLKLMEYINVIADKLGATINYDDLGREDRVVQQIVRGLEGLENNPAAKAVAATLKDRYQCWTCNAAKATEDMILSVIRDAYPSTTEPAATAAQGPTPVGDACQTRLEG